jgi:hypothetical protein
MPASRHQATTPERGLRVWKRLKLCILAKKSAQALDTVGEGDVTIVAKIDPDRLQVHCRWKMSGVWGIGQRSLFFGLVSVKGLCDEISSCHATR